MDNGRIAVTLHSEAAPPFDKESGSDSQIALFDSFLPKLKPSNPSGRESSSIHRSVYNAGQLKAQFVPVVYLKWCYQSNFCLYLVVIL